MGDSYNAQEEYREFAKSNYLRMRGDIEQALEAARAAGDDRPVLMVVGEMQEPFLLSGLFNWAVPDKHENPPRAAAYSFLAAVKVAEELAGRGNVILSFELDPDIKGYNGQMSNVSMDSHSGIISFKGLLAGHLQRKGYRVSYDDMEYNVGEESQDRFKAQIAEINRVGAHSRHKPDIVLRYGSAKYFGLLQGHRYKSFFDYGGALTKESAVNPFREKFAQSLFYNAAFGGFARLGSRLQPGTGEAISYFTNPKNAVQLGSPPGAFPKGHDMEDIMQDVQDASKEYAIAQKGEEKAPQQATILLGSGENSSGLMMK